MSSQGQGPDLLPSSGLSVIIYVFMPPALRINSGSHFVYVDKDQGIFSLDLEILTTMSRLSNVFCVTNESVQTDSKDY